MSLGALLWRYLILTGVSAAALAAAWWITLMLLYNGQRGASGRGGKYFFYVFYPAHVYVLYGLSWLLYLWMQ